MGVGLVILAMGVAEAVAPPKPLIAWATSEHHPAGMAPLRRDADVPILLRVEADGSTHCKSVNKAAPRGLARTSCVLVASRWPYLPARDSTGKFVASDVAVTVRWKAGRLPGAESWDGAVPLAPDLWLTAADFPSVATTRRIAVSFRVSPAGKAIDCTIEASSGEYELDALVCPLIQKRAALLPAVDKAGIVRVAIVHWSISALAK